MLIEVADHRFLSCLLNYSSNFVIKETKLLIHFRGGELYRSQRLNEPASELQV